MLQLLNHIVVLLGSATPKTNYLIEQLVSRIVESNRRKPLVVLFLHQIQFHNESRKRD